MAILSDEQIHNLALIIECNGRVSLQCDQYVVSLFIDNVVSYRPATTREVVYVHVDGRINVAWCNISCDQSKFFMPIVINKTDVLYRPYFYTARAALEHINAAADHVELLLSQHSGQWKKVG